MNFSASIAVTGMHAANATLAGQGYGPACFSIPAYAGASATHALLHCWHNPALQAAIASIPGVTVVAGLPDEEGVIVAADPAAVTQAAAQALGATWGAGAPLLTGTVTPGLHKDADGALWWVITGYSTVEYPNPAIIPALIRRARVPGVAAPWKQPLDQYDAYKLLNPFTNLPDECTHAGKTWYTTVDNNVWQPGTQNSQWLKKGAPVVVPPVEPPANEWPAWKAWTSGLNADLYQVGAKVTHKGSRWVNATANSHWEPGVFGWTKQ